MQFCLRKAWGLIHLELQRAQMWLGQIPVAVLKPEKPRKGSPLGPYLAGVPSKALSAASPSTSAFR